jgi:hypothetical protein
MLFVYLRWSQIRWFKHISTSRNDPAIRLLLANFGFEGYGLYWTILEIIAENLDCRNITSATMTAKQWCNSVKISPKKFQKILLFCSENFGFIVKNNAKLITINCPKLLKYRDEYSRKQGRKSGQTPDI